MGLVGDISPKNMTDRPILEHRADLGQSSNTRTRMDPLSEVFGSMSIQEAVYKRLEATAPWGVRYSGDIGPRIRFILVVRGSARGSKAEPSPSPPAIFSFPFLVTSPLH